MTALDMEEKHLRRRSAPIPPFVSQRLSTLQTEIISSLIREGAGAVLGNSSHAPSVPSVSAVSPNAFTENLERMAKYYFDQGGKLFRPTVALLMADACNQIVQPKRYTRPGQEVCHNQYKIAMIAEMIHTASLVHDDVIDESDKRRGTPTVNAVWGNKMAVLVGDFILARATQVLCSIGRPPVISTMAEIIEDLVKGEFMQLTSVDGAARERLTHYLTKTFRKTASLFAHSCRAAAMLSDGTETAENRAFAYGRHLGVAFQLIDDLLDFVASSDELGKPVANDLKLGLATAPVLFAAQEHPQLEAMMARRFSIEGDPNAARQLVLDSRGLVRTRELAKEHAHAAAKLAEELPNGDGVSDVLVELALSQLDRSC